jgi:DNA invertase Pin-like site-specific DNA recombinase
VFGIFASIAEFERELIRSSVRRGSLDTKLIAALRAKGVGWKRIAAEMGVGVRTIYRVALEGSKIRERVF